MHRKLLATVALATNLVIIPAFADTALPPLQPANPVFEEFTINKRPSVCNGFADFGSITEQTMQLVVVDPLVSIAFDIARLFRPFFTDAATTQEASRKSAKMRRPKPQSPSNMVRVVARKRICG